MGLGLCVLDHSFLVEKYPRNDDKIEALAFARQVGGPVPTALCTAAKFGLSAIFLGALGDDFEGRLIEKELSSFGVNTAHLDFNSEIRTPRAFIIVDKSTGKRTVVLDRASSVLLSMDQINSLPVQKARCILLDGRETDAALLLAKKVRRNGGEVILDIGSNRTGFLDLFPHVDHLVVSEKFSCEFTGVGDPESAALQLSKMGFKSVVITSGARGCLGISGPGEIVRQKAFDVEVVDTTGAGDVFHGAYIYGLSCQWEFPRILEFASAAAALDCTKLGGSSGIPSLVDVLNIL